MLSSVCGIEASGRSCQHAHPSHQRPSLIDTECVFQAINQELHLKMTCLEVYGHAGMKEAIVIILFGSVEESVQASAA